MKIYLGKTATALLAVLLSTGPGMCTVQARGPMTFITMPRRATAPNRKALFKIRKKACSGANSMSM